MKKVIRVRKCFYWDSCQNQEKEYAVVFHGIEGKNVAFPAKDLKAGFSLLRLAKRRYPELRPYLAKVSGESDSIVRVEKVQE